MSNERQEVKDAGDESSYKVDDPFEPLSFVRYPLFSREADVFGELEAIASGCSMDSVAGYLHKTRMASLSSLVSRIARQVDIRDLHGRVDLLDKLSVNDPHDRRVS